MADFGFWELALVALVALLIVGPERLPKLAAEAGRWFGRVRRLAGNFKNELDLELRDTGLRESTREARDAMDDAAAAVNNSIGGLDPAGEALDQAIDSGRYVRDVTPPRDDAAGAPAGDAQTSEPASAAQAGDPASVAQTSEPASTAQAGEPASAAQAGDPASAAPGGHANDSPGNRPGPPPNGSAPAAGPAPDSPTGGETPDDATPRAP